MTENQAPAATAMLVDPKIAARWRVCLHEAGHAVAGRHLLRRTARAVVFDDPCGLADLGGDGGVPASFEDALATAAGPAAEVLAKHHAPPESPLAVPLEITYAEEVKPLREKLRHCTPDHVTVARWCIGGIEKQPDRWAKRHNWIHREARIFVARHRQEIADVAAQLYVQGIVTLFSDRVKGNALSGPERSATDGVAATWTRQEERVRVSEPMLAHNVHEEGPPSDTP